jgi:hypothetical protein
MGPTEVLPQRTVWGRVEDTAYGRIAGAQIAVDGTSLSTVTRADGYYELRGGIASPTTVRVAKEGYVAQTRAVNWQLDPLRAQEHFMLEALGHLGAISGDYTMTLSADSACADLPSEARSRTYTASLVFRGPGNPQYRITVQGDSVVLSSPSPDNYVAGDFVTLGFWELNRPAVVDQIAPNTYVTFSGTATATVTPAPSVISAAFDGRIDYCSLKRPISIDDIDDLESCGAGSRLEPTPSQPVTYASCQSKNHRLVLTRR